MCEILKEFDEFIEEFSKDMKEVWQDLKNIFYYEVFGISPVEEMRDMYNGVHTNDIETNNSNINDILEDEYIFDEDEYKDAEEIEPLLSR
jgi:hypothetical protein